MKRQLLDYTEIDWCTTCSYAISIELGYNLNVYLDMLNMYFIFRSNKGFICQWNIFQHTSLNHLNFKRWYFISYLIFKTSTVWPKAEDITSNLRIIFGKDTCQWFWRSVGIDDEPFVTAKHFSWLYNKNKFLKNKNLLYIHTSSFY